MALTGILDQLRGKGIGFAIFNAPFTLHNGVLEIKDARASGTELGMTAEGRVANDTVNFKGTIVPFYAVNSVLGKIPLVGPIFSGGEKGGGLLFVTRQCPALGSLVELDLALPNAKREIKVIGRAIRIDETSPPSCPMS